MSALRATKQQTPLYSHCAKPGNKPFPTALNTERTAGGFNFRCHNIYVECFQLTNLTQKSLRPQDDKGQVDLFYYPGSDNQRLNLSNVNI